ncbi:MAG TPA: hypothetical protein VFQ77_01900 [Pseudonocardiaceae bacterium]|jgi:hypothetical protein|nr:hypothetical protein [Pseudonocardiaceae bacterium]
MSGTPIFDQLCRELSAASEPAAWTQVVEAGAALGLDLRPAVDTEARSDGIDQPYSACVKFERITIDAGLIVGAGLIDDVPAIRGLGTSSSP